MAADARLHALRAQINPHSLFNTLNTIASKSRTAPDEARQLIQRLADFFRYATQQEGQFADFAHEYFFVRTYMTLEQARFSERLEVQYDIDPQVLPAQVPMLVIQPLVENAVKHGIAPQPKGGTITLRARVDALAGSIRISVRDNGFGMAPELLAAIASGSYRSASGGVGMRNIHERLDQLYGPRYSIRHSIEPWQRNSDRTGTTAMSEEESSASILRCLIVDDEAPARDELRFLLDEAGGVQVVGAAATAEEAGVSYSKT